MTDGLIAYSWFPFPVIYYISCVNHFAFSIWLQNLKNKPVEVMMKRKWKQSGKKKECRKNIGPRSDRCVKFYEKGQTEKFKGIKEIGEWRASEVEREKDIRKGKGKKEKRGKWKPSSRKRKQYRIEPPCCRVRTRRQSLNARLGGSILPRKVQSFGGG